jgi:hypothetical protein
MVAIRPGESADILSGRVRYASTAGTGGIAGGRGGPSSLHLDRYQLLVCQEPASDDGSTATNNQPAANHDFFTTDDPTCSDNDDHRSAIGPGPLSNWVVLREQPLRSEWLASSHNELRRSGEPVVWQRTRQRVQRL